MGWRTTVNIREPNVLLYLFGRKLDMPHEGPIHDVVIDDKFPGLDPYGTMYPDPRNGICCGDNISCGIMNQVNCHWSGGVHYPPPGKGGPPNRTWTPCGNSCSCYPNPCADGDIFGACCIHNYEGDPLLCRGVMRRAQTSARDAF